MLNRTDLDDGEGISAEEDFRIKATSFLMFQIGWLMFFFFPQKKFRHKDMRLFIRLFHTKLDCMSVLGNFT